MIFERNRKVGSFSHIDCGRTCFDNPTLNSPLYFRNRQNRAHNLPVQERKTKQEWIKGRKPYRAPMKSACDAQNGSIALHRPRPWTTPMVQRVMLRLRCPAQSPSGHGRCRIRFARENARLYNFARILGAKPLSTGVETALLPFINGKTTCSINQPHTPPPAPPARWPAFVLSSLPSSGLVPSHA